MSSILATGKFQCRAEPNRTVSMFFVASFCPRMSLLRARPACQGVLYHAVNYLKVMFMQEVIPK